MGKGDFTLGTSPGLAPWPARLGSIWVALDGSSGLPDGTFPFTIDYTKQEELWAVVGKRKKQSQP